MYVLNWQDSEAVDSDKEWKLDQNADSDSDGDVEYEEERAHILQSRNYSRSTHELAAVCESSSLLHIYFRFVHASCPC